MIRRWSLIIAVAATRWRHLDDLDIKDLPPPHFPPKYPGITLNTKEGETNCWVGICRNLCAFNREHWCWTIKLIGWGCSESPSWEFSQTEASEEEKSRGSHIILWQFIMRERRWPCFSLAEVTHIAYFSWSKVEGLQTIGTLCLFQYRSHKTRFSGVCHGIVVFL